MSSGNRALPALLLFWRRIHRWGPAGWVYFIHHEDGGAVKIGHTKGLVQKRIDALQAGSPLPLKLIVALRGSTELERRFHGCFEDDRLHNEWFDESSDLLELFELIRAEDFEAQLTALMDDFEMRDHTWQPPRSRSCNCPLTVFPQPA